jgi:hypothetical protein
MAQFGEFAALFQRASVEQIKNASPFFPNFTQLSPNSLSARRYAKSVNQSRGHSAAFGASQAFITV